MKKKTPGDVILHKCTKTHDHMLYCSWDMVCDRCSCFFFHFGWYFSLLPPNSPQNENFKKMKKILEISFYTSVPKIMIICYTVPEIWHVTHVIFIFHSGLFFTLFTPLRAHKIKISKKVKKGLEISSFYPFVPTIMMYGSWDMLHERWMDRPTIGWTDGWKKWHIEVGALPKKYFHKQHWSDWHLMWNNNNLKYQIKSK